VPVFGAVRSPNDNSKQNIRGGVMMVTSDLIERQMQRQTEALNALRADVGNGLAELVAASAGEWGSISWEVTTPDGPVHYSIGDGRAFESGKNCSAYYLTGLEHVKDYALLPTDVDSLLMLAGKIDAARARYREV